MRAPCSTMDMAGVLKLMAEAKERELALMAEAHSARERALQVELEAAKREAALREEALRAGAAAALREAALREEAARKEAALREEALRSEAAALRHDLEAQRATLGGAQGAVAVAIPYFAL